MGGWSLNRGGYGPPRDAKEGECGWLISYKGIPCGSTIPRGVEQPYCDYHMGIYRHLEEQKSERNH